MKHSAKIALALLAATTWWFSFIQEPDEPIKTDKLAHKVDYYLRNFSMLSMTESGLPKQRLTATYMEHFADDDSTEITSPLMTMYTPNKPELRIISETGYVSADGELVLLKGAVSITRGSSKSLESMQIDTHNLSIQLPNDYAETDEFVKIVSGNNTIQGTGLEAHFREPINIKILADVRGNHEIQ